eukprot:8303678-Karenia_brevis.AAC.1
MDAFTAADGLGVVRPAGETSSSDVGLRITALPQCLQTHFQCQLLQAGRFREQARRQEAVHSWRMNGRAL